MSRRHWQRHGRHCSLPPYRAPRAGTDSPGLCQTHSKVTKRGGGTRWLQRRTEPSTGRAPAPHTSELGNPPPRYPNTFGQQERGSTAAHRKVISKSRRACSQAPGRPDPFLKRGSSVTSRDRQTLISQAGDHRKGRPRAPHHTHPR